jgi:hypothetical protein
VTDPRAEPPDPRRRGTPLDQESFKKICAEVVRMKNEGLLSFNEKRSGPRESGDQYVDRDDVARRIWTPHAPPCNRVHILCPHGHWMKNAAPWEQSADCFSCGKMYPIVG